MSPRPLRDGRLVATAVALTAVMQVGGCAPDAPLDVGVERIPTDVRNDESELDEPTPEPGADRQESP